MSLLRNPNEDPQINPVLSTLLPSDLAALKKALNQELNGLDQLLEKIMHVIHKTVNKMHADPEQMWQQIDFQAEAIEESIKKFCLDVLKTLESKSPPETVEEEKGIRLLVRQLEWDLIERYSAEEYVESLLIRLDEKGPETLLPQDLLSPAKNKEIDPCDYHIAGYPGRPLPTGSWWLYLAHRLGAGYRMMTVVGEGARIDDPLAFISYKAAQQFDPEVLVGAQLLIPLSLAFHPNVNQGCYLVKNTSHGIAFSQTEQFHSEQNNFDTTLSPDFSYTLAAEAKEGFDQPPMISSYDDHCAAVHHQKQEASLTIPLTRGSPYMTLLYRHCTPLVRVAGMSIDKNSIRAYRYYLVVSEEQLIDPKTQISPSQAQQQGVQAHIGEAVLLPNRESLEGQIFTFQIDKTKESYCIFSSAPIQFKTVWAEEKFLLPEGAPLPKQDPERFLSAQAGKVPYSSVVAYKQGADINGLEALSPCAEATLRIAKIPAGSPQEKGLSFLLQHAWVYATGGRMSVIEEGAWKSTYTLQHINPFAHLHAINPPQLKQQELLIALLDHDSAALTAESPQIDLVYKTLLGPAHCAIATGQELHFSKHIDPIQRKDSAIPLLKEGQKQVLIEAFVYSAEQLDLKARATSTLLAARHIQNAAEAAHALFTLLQTDPELIDNEAFMRAFQTTLSIAKAGLDDYLSGALLSYDSENKIILASLVADLSTACGQDHHRLFGYLIRAAADLHEITPEWFDTQRKGIVDLLVNEICSPYDHNPYFPKTRLWDPYTGLGRGSGAAIPQSLGMSDESIGEDLNSLQGIVFWAKTTRQKQLEHFAGTLAARLSSAAQSLYLPGSPTSIYNQIGAKTFAHNVLCCGIHNDIQTSLRNTLNLEGNPLISNLAMQTMGNSDWIDPQTAQRAFEFFFDYRLKSFNYEKFSSHFSRSPLFQNKIRKQAASDFPIDRYMIAIITLVPLIARVSPHAADAVLKWYMRSHELAPNDYPLLTAAQYPLAKMEILALMEQEEDPIPAPLAENDLPFLPESSNTLPLQFWLDKASKWLHSPQLDEAASKLAENLHQAILSLIANKGTIQDLHLWARAIVIPSIQENTFFTATRQDLYPFCVITQTDLQDLLAAQPAKQQPSPAEDSQPSDDLDTPPLFSPSNAFIRIKAELTAYLSERTIQLYQAQSFLGVPQEIPSTDTQWRKLSSLAQIKLQQLQHDIATARKPNHWTALAVKYGFKGTVLQIQKQAAYALHLLSALLSARLALSCFLEALTKITNLEMAGSSREELAGWAEAFDISGLTSQDLAAWKIMEAFYY